MHRDLGLWCDSCLFWEGYFQITGYYSTLHHSWCFMKQYLCCPVLQSLLLITRTGGHTVLQGSIRCTEKKYKEDIIYMRHTTAPPSAAASRCSPGVRDSLPPQRCHLFFDWLYAVKYRPQEIPAFMQSFESCVWSWKICIVFLFASRCASQWLWFKSCITVQ